MLEAPPAALRTTRKLLISVDGSMWPTPKRRIEVLFAAYLGIPCVLATGVWLLVMYVLLYYAEASGFHGQVFVCEGGCAYFVDYFALSV